MLITNGKVTRNIAAGRLGEYIAKGYVEIKETKPTAKKPKK